MLLMNMKNVLLPKRNSPFKSEQELCDMDLGSLGTLKASIDTFKRDARNAKQLLCLSDATLGQLALGCR